MFSKISFQTFLNSSCVLSVSKNDSKNILSNGKNPSHLIVKVINYDKTFILPAIFDNFEEIIKIPEIKLPIWIHTYLKNKRKDLSNLCGEILPTFDIITISSPLTIEIKFIEVFYMNEQIHDRGIFFSFFKLPELLDLNGIFLRSIKMQNNKLLLAKSFYLISILEWQVLIKIERISSQNLFNLEYNNVLINLEDHTIDHNFSYNFLPLLSLKSQLRLPMNYDFLDCFCEKVIYKSRENSFSNNIHKILTIIYNSRFIKSLDSCFSMDKISLTIKLADNLIGNHFLRCLIKELTPKICNIYLNIFNLQGCFMNEEEFLSKEFKEFILLLEKNFPDASRKLIIFIDLREISSQTQKEIPKILEILLELFSKYSNMNYFFISLPNLPLDKIVNTTIPLDFSDTKLLSLMLETICKDIGIKEISYENRSNYFQSISSLVSPENLKNIFVYAKKVQLKLNIIKKTVEP